MLPPELDTLQSMGLIYFLNLAVSVAEMAEVELVGEYGEHRWLEMYVKWELVLSYFEPGIHMQSDKHD